MEIQTIGESKIVIYLTGDDVKRLPVAPHEITTVEASDILRQALGPTYNHSWESVYFELFPGRDSLLLFALQHAGSPYFFTFTNIEPVISAAKASPPGLISYLTYLGDTYYLIVYPWNGEYPPHVLNEYGQELRLPAQFSLHLSEHSNVIAGPSALDTLRSSFS